MYPEAVGKIDMKTKQGGFREIKYEYLLDNRIDHATLINCRNMAAYVSYGLFDVNAKHNGTARRKIIVNDS